MLSKNFKITFFLSLLVFTLSLYANLSNFIDDPELLALFPPFIKGVDVTYNTHLGGEYYFMAQSIADGKGFSNPFNESTGPTAWMPPVYPLLLALLITLFKSKLIVATIILFAKNIVLIFTGITIYNIAKKTSKRLKPEWILFIYLIFLISFFRWFFQITHDIWLILFFINLIFIFGIRIWEKRLTLRASILWGLIGGGAVCTSPVVGFTWGLLTIFSFYLFMKNNTPLKKFLIISTVICLLINSTWTIRNYIIFKSFIPVKSNLFYDAYKSNFVKENGMPDESFLLNFHPIWSHHPEHITDKNESKNHAAWNSQKVEFDSYKLLGEKKYLENYEKKFKQRLAEQPQLFLKKVFKRLLAITLVYYPYNLEYESKFLIWKSIVHAFPFCFLLLALLFQGKRSVQFGCAVFIYISFLTPYLLVSYYIRYSIPLVPLLALFVFWGVDMILNRNRK